MATTNHVVVPNFAPSSGSQIFNQLWKLTRALKKAGWKYLASGNGSTKDATNDPALDLWGAGTVSNAGGTASITIGTPARGRALVSGLSGIVAADKGRFLTLSGSANGANNHEHQIEEVVSASSVRIDARNFAVVAETASLTWDIRDPLGDSFPSISSVAAWWCARGPSTLKIPITAAPTPGPTGSTFVRGENVVQTTTGAEGEIVGYVYDSGAGYLVIAPRLRGTGSGVYGWDTSNTITGDVSGASVTQNGTALEYRHEMVIHKSTDLASGTIYQGTFEPVADATATFGYCATQSGCTASVAPGEGGTGNAFPAHAWVHWGNGTPSHQSWFGTNFALTCGNAQIMVADCIEEEDHSADGSWILPFSIYALPGGGHNGYAFQRVDDCEDGDLDPYVSMAPVGGMQTLYNNTRTAAGNQTSSGGVTGDAFSSVWLAGSQSGTAHVIWKGWRTLWGNFQDFEACMLRVGQSSTTTLVLAQNYTSSDRLATAPVPTKAREPIWIVSTQTNRKMRKGTLRWLWAVGGGNGTDTYDNKQWLQLTPTAIPLVGGPWDGSSAAQAF
jgi:hypothetical protein